MRKKLNSKGFTLIELLIVIIIIGILAAIAFVAYSGSQNKAHKADAQSTVGQVHTKLGEYNADNNNYPATMSDLENWLGSSAGGNNAAMVSTLQANSGGNYTYTVTPTGCGDTVASGGTVTAGTACNTYLIQANGAQWGDSTDTSVKATN